MSAMPRTVGFRLSQADFDKLSEIAQRTRRHPADIFRLLLRAAELTGHPDLTLAPGAMVAQGLAEEVREGIAQRALPPVVDGVPA
jgi:hypothetical protein